MNKTAKHVFRLYVIASKLKRLPTNVTRTRYSQIATLPYSSYSKSTRIEGKILINFLCYLVKNCKTDTLPFSDQGLPATLSGSETQANDVVATVFLTAKTPEDIFKAIKQYRPLMKGVHALQALRMLDGMRRQKNLTDLSIGKKVEFLQICELLINNIKSYDVNDAVYMLKVCQFFGIPSTSVVAQTLLQFIRQHLNNLMFHRLLELHFELGSFKSTPLSDALQIAVPIMCEIQINNKMIDLSDSAQLVNALHFLTNIRSSPKSTEIIVNALREKGDQIPITHAKKVFKYMCDLDHLPPAYQEVLHNMQQIIIRHMNRLNFFDIQVLLGKISKNVFHRGNKDFYCEEFIDACAKAAISEDFGFEEGVRLLRVLCSLDHTHIRLIDYLAAKCFENPDVLSKSSQTTIMILVIGLAMSDYKPIFWESMQEIISKRITKDDVQNKSIYMNFVVGMAVLDFFDFGLIKKVFSESYLQSQLLNKKTRINWNLLLLYQSVKTFCPTYAGPWPSQQILDTAMNNISSTTEKPSLLPALEKALGGSQYVLSNLKSKIGHQIGQRIFLYFTMSSSF